MSLTASLVVAAVATVVAIAALLVRLRRDAQRARAPRDLGDALKRGRSKFHDNGD